MNPTPPALGGPDRSIARRFRSLEDLFFSGLSGAAAIAVLAVFAISLYFLIAASWSSLTTYGWGFVVGIVWNPTATPVHPIVYGALPAIYGTLLVAGLGMLIGVPVSLGIAMFLTELAPWWVRGPLSFVIELLAAVPSVVFGVWGLFVLVPYMGHTVDPALAGTIGKVPVIGGAFQPTQLGFTGLGFLTAGVILGIMVIPTISAVTREAFLAVPIEQREAALSLGATRWEATRISVFPYARQGVLGAITLGLGRAIGETIAVVLVIGGTYQISSSLLANGTTIAAFIAYEFGEAIGTERAALLELGLILLIVSLLINTVARLLVRRGSSISEGAG